MRARYAGRPCRAWTGTGRPHRLRRRPMTTRMGSLVVAVVLMVAVAACTPPATAGPHLLVDCATFEGEGADGALVERQLEAQVNQTVQITVCANPSTGFSWEEPRRGGRPASSSSSTGSTRPSAGRLARTARRGSRFAPRRAGNGTIHFVYSQPWEGGKKGAWRLEVGVAVASAGG